MEKIKKEKFRILMKTTALALACIMLSQFFPTIVLGVRYSNEINSIILEEEKITEKALEENEKPKEGTESKEEQIDKESNKQNENEQEKIKQEEIEEKKEEAKGNSVNEQTKKEETEGNFVTEGTKTEKTQEEYEKENNKKEQEDNQDQEEQKEHKEEIQQEIKMSEYERELEKEIIGEIIEKRTLNEKHFMKKDGSIIASVYPMNVHYEENGQLFDIDNSLEEINEKEEQESKEENNNITEAKVEEQKENNNIIGAKVENQKGNNSITEAKVEEQKGNNNIIGAKVENQKGNNIVTETKVEEQKGDNSITEVKVEEQKENNNIKETKTESQEETPTILQNKSNTFKVKFSKKANKNNLVKINLENNNIKWSLKNSNKVEAKKINQKAKEETGKTTLKNISSETIKYENILENIDIEYNIIADKIKENIILKNKASINQEITFEYNTNGLKAIKTEDGKIIFYKDKKENVIFYLYAPYMYDAKEEMTDKIDIEISNKNNKTTITIKPNKQWLEEEQRTYPVTIDPIIETSLSYKDIEDTFIYEGGDAGASTRYNSHILRVGNNNKVKNPTRTLIKFNLPQLKTGDQVIGAMLNICSYPDTNEWTPTTTMIQMDVHKITTPWESKTATWNTLKDKYDTKITDYEKYQFDYNNQIKFYSFDVTAIVKEWYVTGNNNGLMIKDHYETYNAAQSDAYFYSSDASATYQNARPYIQIVYRNQTGLEEYQTYHTQTIGKAGTVYTNDYNGNLVLIHQDAKTPGNLMPVAISHIYNTNDKDIDIGYGKGFRLNLSQTINLETISGTEYAKYIDEDGTAHYLKKEGTNYKDEDGLGLTLKQDSTGNYQLEDKEKNTLTFQKRENQTIGKKWHLKEAKDTYGNKITIELNQDQQKDFRIQKVTDAAGDSITFGYDANQKLETINDKDGRTVRYIYIGDYILKRIMYYNGESISYLYDNQNLLTTVNNIDNSKIEYEYYKEKVNRIKSIKEYGTGGETGNTLNITYGNNITKFTNNKGYTNTYTFNNSGQTISISDFGKEANNIENAYGKMYEYGQEQNNKNKLTLEGELISIKEKENNLIKNGNFSNGLTNWTTYNKEENDKIENGTYKIEGNSHLDKHIKQEINISGKKGDALLLAAWVNSKAIPNNQQKGSKLALSIHYKKTDGTWKAIDKKINVDSNGWQYKSEIIITESDYTSITIYLVCDKNANQTHFDNIGLFKEEIGQSYTYDQNGNITTTQNNTKNQQTFQYNQNNKLTASIQPNGGKIEYQYDQTNPNKLTSATNWIGNKYTYAYDIKGNITNIQVNEAKDPQKNINVKYKTHMQDIGTTQTVSNGQTAGQPNDTKRIEAFTVELEEKPEQAHIKYQAHVQDIGWQDWVQDGETAGTTGQSKRIESFKIKLENMPGYTVKYRAYVEGIGWQDWVQDGETAGTIWQSKKIYAIQIKLEYSNKYYQAQAEYSSNGNYQTKLIDELGNETKYQYNENTGTTTKIIDAKNKETNYTYDRFDRLTKVTKQANGKTYTNQYTYKNNDQLETITHNNFKYTFIYDSFGNVKQTKVGTQILATNNYETNNGNISSITYGNNQTITYEYDRFNRPTKQTGTNGNHQYSYDAKSNIKTIQDSTNNNTKTYTYDLSDRLTKENNTNGFKSEYEYDTNSNISKKTYTLTEKTNTIQYNQDKANRTKEIKISEAIRWENRLDNLSRITAKRIVKGSDVYTTQYTYKDIENITNKTTTQLKTIQNGNNQAITYEYDQNGNIETIKTGNQETNKYNYDEINQLTKEINISKNKATTYEYDQGGNITSKKEYNYTNGQQANTPTKTTTYTYGNTNWKDQLTSYNGKTITYDAIGNTTAYDGNTYTWQNGRQLAEIKNTNKGQTINYKYNENGIRTQKTVNGITTNYYVDGNKVIYEKTGDTTIYYTYDEAGNIIGLKYKETQYYYTKNGQNDIIGILDTNLNQVVNYEYDAWGNIESIKDEKGNTITSNTNIGIINPYRYKGYRYDTETGLYYLNSRYYNPEWGRFINFDNYGGQVGEILSHNGYAYCKNNPVNMVDEDGNMAIVAGVGIIATGILGLLASNTPSDNSTSIITEIGTLIESGINVVGKAATTIGQNINTAITSMQASKTIQNTVIVGATTTTKISTQTNKDRFPINPYRFKPAGLTIEPYKGTKNGKIIVWKDCNGNVKFEWNEDFVHGPHYHIMPEVGHKHIGIGNIHFKPLAKIPEPYKSIYFY